MKEKTFYLYWWMLVMHDADDLVLYLHLVVGDGAKGATVGLQMEYLLFIWINHS
jgi:hypothetical protein